MGRFPPVAPAVTPVWAGTRAAMLSRKRCEAPLMEFTEPVLLELESQRRSPAAVAKRDRLMDLLQPMPSERILALPAGSDGMNIMNATPFSEPLGRQAVRGACEGSVPRMAIPT